MLFTKACYTPLGRVRAAGFDSSAGAAGRVEYKPLVMPCRASESMCHVCVRIALTHACIAPIYLSCPCAESRSCQT